MKRLGYQDKDKEALIDYVMSNSSMTSREDIWKEIQTKVQQYITDFIAKKRKYTFAQLIKRVQNYTLEDKKKFVKKRLDL